MRAVKVIGILGWRASEHASGWRRGSGTGPAWPMSGSSPARARRAGLPPPRVNDLVIAVSELAANTLAHTRGPGTFTLWVTDQEVICQVQDQGQIIDPLAGRLRPAPDAPDGGRDFGSYIRSAIESRSAPDRLAPQYGCICGAAQVSLRAIQRRRIYGSCPTSSRAGLVVWEKRPRSRSRSSGSSPKISQLSHLLLKGLQRPADLPDLVVGERTLIHSPQSLPLHQLCAATFRDVMRRAGHRGRGRFVERVPVVTVCIPCVPGRFLGRWCRQSLRCAPAVHS